MDKQKKSTNDLDKELDINVVVYGPPPRPPPVSGDNSSLLEFYQENRILEELLGSLNDSPHDANRAVPPKKPKNSG
jgi:hypothetical protein